MITVSEKMSVVAVFRNGQKRSLEPIARVLARAEQALQILERYKSRLDNVSGAHITLTNNLYAMGSAGVKTYRMAGVFGSFVLLQ